jgi:hypothetical protein
MIMRTAIVRVRGLRVGLAMAALGVAAVLASVPAFSAGGTGGYRFDLLNIIGNPIPGDSGVFFANDFEPGAINNNGDIAYGADVSVDGGGEGIFLLQKGRTREITRTGLAAPGGGVFGPQGFFGPVTMNNKGDLAFGFALAPTGSPNGFNGGVYRYSVNDGKLSAVVVPFVTPLPGGGGLTFQGTSFYATLDDSGTLAFPGMFATDAGVHVPGEAYSGLGVGIFQADRRGRIASVVIPGDPAPNGGSFDFANEPGFNSGGDMVFGAHVAGEEAAIPGFPPQDQLIAAFSSTYVRDSAKGTLLRVVHANDTPAPGGGVFRQAFHAVINNRGDVAFAGDVTPAPAANDKIGAFLFTKGQILALARPGDPMPGGGNLVRSSLVGGNYGINNSGDVAFSAVLDTDVDGDGIADTGVYRWSHGQLTLVAKSGTVLPGIGTVFQMVAGSFIVIPPPPTYTSVCGTAINDRGAIVFQPALTDGRTVMIQATPAP